MNRWHPQNPWFAWFVLFLVIFKAVVLFCLFVLLGCRKIDPGIQSILKRKAVVYATCAQGHSMQPGSRQWSIAAQLHQVNQVQSLSPLLGHVRKFTTTIWIHGIWIHGLHYKYGVTHVLRDAEKLEELLYVYKSCVNHIGEQKKDSALSWQPLSPRYYQYIKWNTLPELQAFKGAKVSRSHPLSSKTDMHWCFEGLSNRIVHFSTGKSSDTIQHCIAAPMFYEACRINKTRQSEASLLRSKLSNSCGFQLSGWVVLRSEGGGAELQNSNWTLPDLRYLFQRLGERPETRGGLENRKPPWIDQCMMTLCC